MLRIPTIVLALLIPALPLAAQQGENRVRFDNLLIRGGLYAAYQQIFYTADFQSLPGVPCCSPGFNGGGGPGGLFGLSVSYPLGSSFLFDIRSEYRVIGGSLRTTEVIGNAIENGEVVDAVSEHRISPVIAMETFGVGATWYPTDSPLSIHGGVLLSLISDATYEQTEVLESPSNATFSNGSTERNRSEGDIPDLLGIEAAVNLGVGYDIDIGSDLIVRPHVEYRLGLTDLMTDSTWKVNALQIGAALTLDLVKPGYSAPEPDPVAEGNATITAVGVRSNGEEVRSIEMSVEEFLDYRTLPVLPYVFFDEGSARIPDRYRRLDRSEAERFDPNGLHHADVLATHHSLLDIIGDRMRRNPEASITLVGCNDDRTTEKGNRDLSRRRAEAVRQYLIDIWSIDDNRIDVSLRDLPEVPSNPDDPDGQAENRRVEIRSTVPSIVAPIATHDTLRMTNPPSLRFRPRAAADEGIESWTIVASQQGRELRAFSGTGSVPPSVDWEMADDQSSIPRSDSPLDFRLIVTDAEGNTFSSDLGSIAIEQITIRKKREEKIDDREFRRVSLTLFDFGESRLGVENERLLDGISEQIVPGSKLEIVGHTDRIGNATFNQSLSEDRARSVAEYLDADRPEISSRILGVGEENLLYDNDLPEGRFYCRTVNVRIDVPVIHE